MQTDKKWGEMADKVIDVAQKYLTDGLPGDTTDALSIQGRPATWLLSRPETSKIPIAHAARPTARPPAEVSDTKTKEAALQIKDTYWGASHNA